MFTPKGVQLETIDELQGYLYQRKTMGSPKVAQSERVFDSFRLQEKPSSTIAYGEVKNKAKFINYSPST